MGGRNEQVSLNMHMSLSGKCSKATGVDFSYTLKHDNVRHAYPHYDFTRVHYS